MVKLRNRSLVIVLLMAACLAPPAVASPRWSTWFAQEIDNPDAGENAESAETTDESPAETPLPADSAVPPELPRTFTLPGQLPQATTLTLEGTSSMAVITRALVEQFQQAFPNAEVVVTEQPAEAALSNLLAGNVDLVAIGRPLTDEERAQGLMEVPISREKTAIIVGADNPFEEQLEAEDFVRIFRGEVTNWQELGGPDLPIRFVDRPQTSDTRTALANYEIFAGDLSTGENQVSVASDSTAEVVEALGDNGISYAIASQVIDQENVRVLAMHNTLPDDPRYPYSQPRNYVYRNAETLPIEVEAFLAFATNAPGQEAVAEAKAAEAADVAAADLPDRVNAVRPNGQGFVTGDRAGTLAFWNIDGTPAGEPINAHTGPVTATAFSPDGQRLISGGADGTIRLWDAAGNPIGDPINAGNGPVTSLVIRSDGSFFSASADGTVQQWDNLGNPIGEPITGHEAAVRDMILTADEATLVTASKDGTIRLWNTADGVAQGDPLVGHQGAVQALAAKPDGSFFSGGADGTVRWWDAAGNQVGEPTPVAGPVTAIAANTDGTSIAVGDETGALQYLSGEGVPVGEAITDIGSPIDDLAFTPDGQRLIVSAGESPQLRDSTGQLIPIPNAEPETEAPEADSSLPPQLQEFWQQIQGLPPQLLWIIPVLILALLLLSLLRSFRKDEEALEEKEIALLPEGSPSRETELPDEDFAGFTREDISDPSLAAAKQTLAEGVSLGNAGRYQAALDRFSKAIELADMERLKAAAAGTTLAGAGMVIARGLARRGTALANLGRMDEALQSINRALEMDSDDVAAWIGKGNILVHRGQLDEALFCFDKAIELNPNVAAAWQGKGKALQRMGREVEARQHFTKAETLGGVKEEIPIELGTPTESASPYGTSAPMPVPVSPPDSTVIEPGPSPATAPYIEPTASTSAEISPIPGSSNVLDTIAPYEPGEPVSEPPSAIEVGPIGIVSPQPPPPISSGDDLPPDLQAAIDNLPPDAEVPDIDSSSTDNSSAVVAPEAELDASTGEPTDTDIPEEVLRSVEDLPAEAESPDPDAPMVDPIDVPPEVEAILAADLEAPNAPPESSSASVTDPMATYMGDDATMAMRPAQMNEADETDFQESPISAPLPPIPATSPIPDQPDDLGDPALEGLPPEVLEALKGIPEDSPDSFDFPPASPAQPPPPPNNPRLRDTSSEASEGQ